MIHARVNSAREWSGQVRQLRLTILDRILIHTHIRTLIPIRTIFIPCLSSALDTTAASADTAASGGSA